MGFVGQRRVCSSRPKTEAREFFRASCVIASGELYADDHRLTGQTQLE